MRLPDPNETLTDYAVNIRIAMREGMGEKWYAQFLTLVSGIQTKEGIISFVQRNPTNPKYVQLAVIWLAEHGYGDMTVMEYIKSVPTLAAQLPQKG